MSPRFRALTWVLVLGFLGCSRNGGGCVGLPDGASFWDAMDTSSFPTASGGSVEIHVSGLDVAILLPEGVQ